MMNQKKRIIGAASLCAVLLALFSGFIALIRLSPNGGGMKESNAAEASDSDIVSTENNFYKYQPFDASNTGKISIGTYAGTAEYFSFTSSIFTEGKVSTLTGKSQGMKIPDLNADRKEYFPIFTNDEMSEIRRGTKSSVPVIMLDNYFQDNVVVFELTNLAAVDSAGMSAKYNGVLFSPNNENNKIVELSNAKSSDEVFTAVNSLAYNKTNAPTIRAFFNTEGFYELYIPFSVVESGATRKVTMQISFYIVDKANYQDYPAFPTNYRESGAYEKFAYGFTGVYPTVTYDPTRYSVNITPNDAGFKEVAAPEEGQIRYQFFSVAEYIMTSKYIFTDYLQRKVEIPRYSYYKSSLSIYGFRAYFGGTEMMSQFFDEDGIKGDANISTQLPTLVNSIADDKSASSDIKLYMEALTAYFEANTATIRPVATNCPPVQFVGNAQHAIGADKVLLSTVAFKGKDGKGWQYKTMVPGAPYSDAGKYVISIYYNANGRMNKQVFYFEINDIIDIRFKITEQEREYTFREIVNQGLYSSKPVQVYFGGDIGAYQIPPNVTLEFQANFKGAFVPVGGLPKTEIEVAGRKFEVVDVSNVFEYNIGKEGDGLYRFVVYYGANYQASSLVEVVVDTAKAKNLTATSTNPYSLADMPNFTMPANTGIFGEGTVTLQWDNKPSGIDYREARVEFREFTVMNEGVEPNSKWTGGAVPAGLYSSYNLAYEETSKFDNYKVVKTASGWKLAETFMSPGLYHITIIDVLNNETPFILIIDSTSASFVQNKTSINQQGVNFISDFDSGVAVAFGLKKVITTHPNDTLEQQGNILTSPVYDTLRAANIIGTVFRTGYGRNVDAISIPIKEAKYSQDGGLYQDQPGALLSGTFSFNREGRYNLRVVDYLGNITEYYIILSNDRSQGLVFADSISREGLAETSSLVETKGGMTNRDYLQFSFYQAAETSTTSYYVSEIAVNFYPLTWDTSSTNYPFASQADGTKSRQYFAETDYTKAVGIKYISINQVPKTEEGIYRIARKYSILPAGSKDIAERFYYFIVDRTGMLDFNPDDNPNDTIKKYVTGITAKFGQKTAAALEFNQNKNMIESNLIAHLTSVSAKYDRDGYSAVSYNLSGLPYSFSSVMPQYLLTNAGKTLDEWTGSTIKYIGGDARASTSNYELLIYDGARAFSYLQVGSANEIKKDDKDPTSANFGVLQLTINALSGSKGVFRINGSIITTDYANSTSGNQPVYTAVIDPTGLLDDTGNTSLTFEFQNTPASFISQIDPNRTRNTFSKTRDGVEQPATADFINRLITKTTRENLSGVVEKYTYNLKQWSGSDEAGKVEFTDNDRFTIVLTTEDDMVTRYTLIIDTKSPTFNLSRITANDNIAKKYETMPQNYIYGLSNDFEFKSEYTGSNTNKYLGVKTITYTRLDEGLHTSLSEPVEFPLNEGAFADIANLGFYKTEYFLIIETDYADHATFYYVQLKGAGYEDDITFYGYIGSKIGSNGDEIVLGMDMRVNSVETFWKSNSSFYVECGSDYYSLIAGKTTYAVGDSIVTNPVSANKAEFIRILDAWLTAGLESGGERPIALKYYDRYEERNEKFYQISDKTPVAELAVAAAGGTSVVLSISNYMTTLPKIFIDYPELKSFFKLDIYEVTSSKIDLETVSPTVTRPNLQIALDYEINNLLVGAVNKELVIRLTDPFGRASVCEYHGQKNATIGFVYSGITKVIDGITYAGDSRGVVFNYAHSVYSISVYRNEALISMNETTAGEISTINFKPITDDITYYRVIGTGFMSGEVLYEREFAFDTRLPEVFFETVEGSPIKLEGLPFTGAVSIRVVSSADLQFGGDVTYIRTEGTSTERGVVPLGLTAYKFDKIGNYKILVTNAVWAQETYEFEIADMDSSLIRVFDDNGKLDKDGKLGRVERKASSVPYVYKGNNIANYFFTLNAESQGDITKVKDNFLEIVASSSTFRALVGDSDKDGKYLPNTFHDISEDGKTLIWCYAIPDRNSAGDVISIRSPIYFATTGVNINNIRVNEVWLNVLKNSLKTYEVYASLKDYNNELSLKMEFPSASTANGATPYNQVPGNTFYMDYYRNGVYIGKLEYGEEPLVLTPVDYGVYDFYIYDLVGNQLKLEGDIGYYTIENVSSPPVLINNEIPISGIIYNDQANFKVEDIFYGPQKFGADYDKYFFISSMTTELNTDVLSDYTFTANEKHRKNSYTFTTPGIYDIKITYRTGETTYIDGEYRFQIVPSSTMLEEFHLQLASNIHVSSITKNGYIVTSTFDVASSGIWFKNSDGTGTYVVTIKIDADNINRLRTKTFEFYIGNRLNTNIASINTKSGSGTDGAVSFQFKPLLISYYYGDAVAIVYKDNVELDRKEINATTLAGFTNVNQFQTVNTSEIGHYYAVVLDSTGDPIYSDSWTITSKPNNMATTVSIVLGVVGIIGGFLFFKTRKNMKVK
jgi:hypothetical protein